MKRNTVCKFIVLGLLSTFLLGIFAQRVSNEQPWSVRMVESELTAT